MKQLPEKAPIWIDTESFGGKCLAVLLFFIYISFVQTFDQNVITHVVATRDGTDKVKRGRKFNKFIVKIDWLNEAMWNWEKPQETQYALQILLLQILFLYYCVFFFILCCFIC